ncbi:MAG: hypothetical protein ABEJ82_00720 [Haloplanus sp.]
MPPKPQYVSLAALLVVLVTVGALGNIGAYRASLERPATGVADVGTPTVPGDPTGPTATSPPTDSPTPAPTPTPTATTQTPTPTPTPAAKDAETATAVPGTPTPTPTAAPTPTTPTPAPDYDGDGIPDGVDRCPTRPETVNGFKDGDGCPDVVATTGAS